MFPPVRPRTTYLEVRFVDVQEPATVGRLVAVLASLMYDDDRRRHALHALECERPHLAEHWRSAAAGDPATASRGYELTADLELVA